MEQQDKLKLTSKYMIIGVLICFAIFLILGLIVINLIYDFETPMAYAIGLFLSTAFSIIRIIMMRRSVEKATSKETSQAAKNTFQVGVLLRQFLIIAFFIGVFILKDYVGIVGVLVGMFFVKISGYISNHMLTKYEEKQKNAT